MPRRKGEIDKKFDEGRESGEKFGARHPILRIIFILIFVAFVALLAWSRLRGR